MTPAEVRGMSVPEYLAFSVKMQEELDAIKIEARRAERRAGRA